MIYICLAAASVVSCGGRKTFPRISTIVQFIHVFYLLSFESNENLLRY